MQQGLLGLRLGGGPAPLCPRASAKEKKTMLDKVFRRRNAGLVACNENTPDRAEEPVSLDRVRALATGAALAVAVDTSPAVLVSIYDYAQRYRDKGRRTA